MKEVLSRIANFLQKHDYEAYVVGGFVRDWLLRRHSADLDIAVAGNSLEIAQQVAREVEGKYVLLDETSQIARVIVTKGNECWQVDFSPLLGGIEVDLARRDFTIDAMALRISRWSGKVDSSIVIDPYDGRKDLELGRVRAVSPGIFEADAARLLRVVRLSAELDFQIDNETEALVRRFSHLIAKVPGERIREELLRLLALPGAAMFINYLDNLGLLVQIIPELVEGKGVQQPKEHFWDVFDHSIKTVATVEYLLREKKWCYGSRDVLLQAPWSEMIKEHFAQEVSKGSDRKMILKLAGLLHDIAKPRTKTVDSKGKIRFLGHAKEGATMAGSILQRLRFSSKESELVVSLIYHHLRPAQMTSGELPTARAVYRYFRDTGDAGLDIIFLALADYLATHGPNLDIGEWQSNCRLISYVLEEHSKRQGTPLPKLVDGYDLMKTFGLKPGKEIGKMLAIIKEAQAVGEIDTKEEALAFVRKKFGLPGVNLERTR